MSNPSMSLSSKAESTSEFRSVCERCRRPTVVCCCAYIHPLPTRTRVVLLQHPHERRKGIGTAHLAHLCLPGSILRVAYDFSRDAVVQSILAEPPPSFVALLFPGPDARDVSTLPPDQNLTLIVVDGTWAQARSLMRANPALQALPRVAFTPRKPSDYRIRKQPAEQCVSTIEALAEVLSIIEPAGQSFERLLDPFHAMVKQQEFFATQVRARRRQALAVARTREKPRLDAHLRALFPRLVCVQGDANAWSVTDPSKREPEIVHWVAHRPCSGETYEAVIAPRKPLGPATPTHVGLPAERLLSGVDAETWRKGFRGFLRDDDILLVWGPFYAGLAAEDGLFLGKASQPDGTNLIDLRAELTRHLQERVGTVEQCVERLGGVRATLGIAGRAGRRLSALVGVTNAVAKSCERAEEAPASMEPQENRNR